MKAKNQQAYTSELDAKEKLIVYVYEYLVHSGAKQAADIFKENIGYAKDIKVNESPGFLADWWCVFWDLYCAAPERRLSQPESSNDARAFHDFMPTTPMSPSMMQTSPPQFMGGPPTRYGPPGQPGARGPPPPPMARMQGPPQQPPPVGPPGGFIPAGSPRYSNHQQHPQPGSHQPPPPPPHMQQGPPMFGPNPDQMGPSGNMNRMTPVPPPQQPQPIMIGMPPGGGPDQVHPQVNSMQGAGPPRNGSHGGRGAGGGPQVGVQQGGQGGGGWQVNYNVNSPASQSAGGYGQVGGPGSNQPPGPNQSGGVMMNDGSMMEVKSSPVNGAGEASSTPHPEEYVMPVPFGQDANDQCEAEILKLKQSMQEDTTKLFEKEQSEFSLGDYSDSQPKWT